MDLDGQQDGLIRTCWDETVGDQQLQVSEPGPVLFYWSYQLVNDCGCKSDGLSRVQGSSGLKHQPGFT